MVGGHLNGASSDIKNIGDTLYTISVISQNDHGYTFIRETYNRLGNDFVLVESTQPKTARWDRHVMRARE